MSLKNGILEMWDKWIPENAIIVKSILLEKLTLDDSRGYTLSIKDFNIQYWRNTWGRLFIVSIIKSFHEKLVFKALDKS